MTADPSLSARSLLVRRGTGRSTFELRVDALDLYPSQVLVVLGPNGSGKSTLLRTLAGLEEPLRGTIERSVSGPVSMVFQRPIALAGSVEHNVRVALLGQDLSRRRALERVGEALQRFGIEHLRDRRAATLSGGELRRLALARAFALRPSVLLLDEPFDDLDGAAQEALSLDLRRAIADTDVALGIVTHDLRRALLLADRIAVLLDGQLAQLGGREQLLRAPATPAIAQIVGMSNLIPGRIAAGGSDGPAVVEVDPTHRIPVPGSPALGAAVWAGVRPEHLKVDVGRGEGVPIGKGVVRHLVSDGWVSTVTVDWAGLDLRTHLIAGRGLARRLHAGDPVQLSVRPQDVHVIQRQDPEPAIPS